ncbi:hypothetical protein [Streptomyces sp. NPDC090022]|uniref:hypothetical protein n=1 Tax=Streptomyces sp. NPDC090022 TaxID=3365920 RepID=UPI0037FB9DAF
MNTQLIGIIAAVVVLVLVAMAAIKVVPEHERGVTTPADRRDARRTTRSAARR